MSNAVTGKEHCPPRVQAKHNRGPAIENAKVGELLERLQHIPSVIGVDESVPAGRPIGPGAVRALCL